MRTICDVFVFLPTVMPTEGQISYPSHAAITQIQDTYTCKQQTNRNENILCFCNNVQLKTF